MTVPQTPQPRRARATGRRAPGAIGLGLLLLVTACGTDPLPEPAPNPSDVAVPVVSDAQLDASLETIGAALAAGDEGSDPALLAPALVGPALAQRTGSYGVRKRDAKLDFAVPLGTERLQDAVPAEQGWPRTVMTVTRQSATDEAPDLMVLTQASPREAYQLVAYTQMLGGATLPFTGGTDQGVEVIAPDATGRLVAPQEAVARYADLLTQGAESKNAALFAKSSFTDDVVSVQGSTRKTLTVDCDGCFEFAAGHTPQAGSLWSFGTEDGGALVVAAIDAAMTITAKKGYKMNLEPELEALSGKDQITSVGRFSHVEVVALYVPPEGEGDTVQVLAVDRVPTAGTVS